MIDIINNLYNLTWTLIGGCIITILVTVCYIIGIIKYIKKDRLITVELEKIQINNIRNKENI